ncbi:MAG: ATP-dependent DNA ligase [Candidatus Woesearchaeota archaeon]
MKYSDLVEYYQKLEATSKRLDKTYILADLLKKTLPSDLETIILLVQGLVFPAHDDRKIGMAQKMALKAIIVASGLDESTVIKEWKKTGDLGETAANLIKGKKQKTLFSESLTIKKVFENIKKLAEMEGQGSADQKVKLLAELLTSAKPLEAKYITRMVLEDLRVGIGEGSLRDAIVWACYPPVFPIFMKCANCGKVMPQTEKCIECGTILDYKAKHKLTGKILDIETIEDLDNKRVQDYDYIQAKDEELGREVYNRLVKRVEEAVEITNDYAIVASRCKAGSLQSLMKIGLVPGTPVKVMLYLKAADIKEAFETVGKPAALEFKYDGFRLQIHRNNKEIKLFTRRLEDVTKQFPDVVEVIKDNIKSHDFILDGEVVGIDPVKKIHIPFQNISQRIKRKHDIHEMIKKLPVELHIFDVLELDGENMIKKQFIERRKAVEKIVKIIPHKLLLANQIITDDLHEANKFYQLSLSEGYEGIMVKGLDAPYKPGARVGYGMKVKPVMESLDLVIVGATWGEGKRGQWLSSFDLACRDGDEFVTIGKVGTGLKEKEEEGLTFRELTKMAKPLITKEDDKHVDIKPKIVLELSYEEIQVSPTYSSGYALRFPRVIRLRPDKGVDEASTIKQVERLFREQKR